MSVNLKVNGREVLVTNADHNEPLLWILREDLGLVGTKFGCGQAACGACTVHVGGVAQRSCVTTCSSVVGVEITTIEGLSTPNSLHPVQVAWTEMQVPQCGYCQAGQMMSAAALIAQNSQPSDAEIDAAMVSNFCRCGTYSRIRAAIHRAAHIARTQKV